MIKHHHPIIAFFSCSKQIQDEEICDNGFERKELHDHFNHIQMIIQWDE